MQDSYLLLTELFRCYSGVIFLLLLFVVVVLKNIRPDCRSEVSSNESGQIIQAPEFLIIILFCFVLFTCYSSALAYEDYAPLPANSFTLTPRQLNETLRIPFQSFIDTSSVE